MSRCRICDHLEGFGSDLNPFVKPSVKVRYRPQIKEYLCDPCAESIQSTILETKKDHDWDYTIAQVQQNIIDPNDFKYTSHEPEPTD